MQTNKSRSIQKKIHLLRQELLLGENSKMVSNFNPAKHLEELKIKAGL